MSEDEERERLQQENTILREALQRTNEELHQSRHSNQDLREGLKQAIMAIERQQECVKDLEGQISCLQERIRTLEGQQAKESHNSSLPPSSDRFVRPPKSEARKRVGRNQVGNTAIVGITCGKCRSPMRCSLIRSNAVNTASTICALTRQPCQSGVR